MTGSADTAGTHAVGAIFGDTIQTNTVSTTFCNTIQTNAICTIFSDYRGCRLLSVDLRQGESTG